MYKKQMLAQKVLCMASLISGVFVFFYALGIMTDLYDTLYSTMRNSADFTDTDVPGSIVYYNMQEFNKVFLNYSIVLILLACLLFITNTHTRRRYYIGNFFATAAYAVYSLFVVIWAHHYIDYFKKKFLEVDFEALKAHAETWETAYSKSTFWFDFQYICFAISIIVVAALVYNVIWKVNLMKEEDKLVEEGKGVAA